MTSLVKRILTVALVAPVAALGACIQGYSSPTAPPTQSGCSTDVVPALAIAVRDSATQQGIATGVQVGGIVTGKQGTYVLTQPVSSDTLTIWLGTIPGTYNVSLRKSGYRDAGKTGIVVPAADSLGCHPRTVTVDISMQSTT